MIEAKVKVKVKAEQLAGRLRTGGGWWIIEAKAEQLVGRLRTGGGWWIIEAKAEQLVGGATYSGDSARKRA